MHGNEIETLIPGHHREMPICSLLVVSVAFTQKPSLTPGDDGIVFGGNSGVPFSSRSWRGNSIVLHDLEVSSSSV
jgi:hypothetical protein